MAKTTHLIGSDDAFAAQLQAFKNSIGGYASKLGITPDEVAAQAADADYFSYVLACHEIMRNSAHQWTDWKDFARAGGNPPPTGVPVATAFPPAVPEVVPGIEARFRALVKRIKAAADYVESVGQALDLEGTEQNGPELNTVQPEIDAAINGTHVNVLWSWGGHAAFLDMCELQVDRGNGKGFVLLALDTTPSYADTALFPPAPTKWTYQAIYYVGDKRVGQWSNPVSVTVGG